MAHAQQQVLDALRTTLVAAATLAGARVFVDRADPLQAQDLPAILVDEAPEGETTQSGESLGPLYQRFLSVRVTCVVANGSTAKAQARELGLQAEKALAAAGTAIHTLAKGGVALQSSRPLDDPTADRLLAAREQDWLVTYFTHATAPDVLV